MNARREAVGEYVQWLAQEPECQMLGADPSGRWLAARGTEHGWLRVWELDSAANLGRLLLSSQGGGYIARTCEWAGDYLVFVRIEGVDDAMRFDYRPPDNLAEFLARHRSVVGWQPATGDTRVIAGEPGGLLLASQTGNHLAVFNRGPKPTDLTVTVYGTTDFGTMSSLVLPEEPDYWGGLLPICWAADEEHIFVSAQARFDEASTRGYRANWQVLLVTDLNGQLEPLTNATDTRLWGEGSFSVEPTWRVLSGGRLNVTPVEEGRLVACTLAPRGSTRTRLGFFDSGGLVRHYPLEREWFYGPKELRQDERSVHTITITPDGRRLILQETDRDSSLDYGEKGWVWAWDYQTRQAQRLALVPEVTAHFGWLRGEYLLVESKGTIEGSGITHWVTHDYGALYVPRLEAQED